MRRVEEAEKGNRQGKKEEERKRKEEKRTVGYRMSEVKGNFREILREWRKDKKRGEEYRKKKRV